MPNSYFQFKSFTIEQDQCSMKVCTDSCLFGAWVASCIEHNLLSPKNILDIGTGTGLLSLMLAQKTDAPVYAVECNANAYTQAKNNCGNSPWNSRLQVFHSDIRNWKPEIKYDLIICNPPFYEDDLLSPDSDKNISKHSTTLSLYELLTIANDLLSNDGHFALLLPWRRSHWFETLSLQQRWYVKQKMLVRQTPLHNYFRTMYLLQKQTALEEKHEMFIKKNNDEYSREFCDLLKDYYLNL
jgi:tRNA1Val (adenine37-N6)-methyltransferase